MYLLNIFKGLRVSACTVVDQKKAAPTNIGTAFESDYAVNG
jgi:hypothetical protein